MVVKLGQRLIEKVEERNDLVSDWRRSCEKGWCDTASWVGDHGSEVHSRHVDVFWLWLLWSEVKNCSEKAGLKATSVGSDAFL